MTVLLSATNLSKTRLVPVPHMPIIITYWPYFLMHVHPHPTKTHTHPSTLLTFFPGLAMYLVGVMGDPLLQNDNEFHGDAKRVSNWALPSWKPVEPPRLHPREAKLASFCFSYVPGFFPPPGLRHLVFSLFGKLISWLKSQQKCFFLRRAFLYNSCLKKLLLSSCSEYYFAFFLILCFLLSLLIYLLSYSWSRFPPLGCTLHSRSDFYLVSPPLVHVAPQIVLGT